VISAAGPRPARRSSRTTPRSSGRARPVSSTRPCSAAASATRRTSAVPSPRPCQALSTSTAHRPAPGRSASRLATATALPPSVVTASTACPPKSASSSPGPRRGVGDRNRERRVAGEQRACSAPTSRASAEVAGRSRTSEPSRSSRIFSSARGSAGTRIASWAASSSSAAARDSSVAVNGHARPSRTCAAPIRSVWTCPAWSSAAGSTRRARSIVATARGALPGSAATMRASASAVVAGSASSPASARTSSVHGMPARWISSTNTAGSPAVGTRTSSSSVTEPSSAGSPTTCSEMMLQPARPTAVASSPNRPGRSSSSTCTRHSTTSGGYGGRPGGSHTPGGAHAHCGTCASALDDVCGPS
jgi:hypothetical protein